jgi:CheY-like chemotaxis protein/anti-sigma regulatory factor (Ser/Thr protein kinase)
MRKALDNATLLGILERQQLALDSMSGLLGSVLDISKLDSGAVVPNPVDCPINDVFERLRSDFEPQAADKSLTLDIQFHQEAVHSDPELLRRLLGNLVSNAIRYTNRGAVQVSCARDGRAVRIDVRDTGIGIPPGELEQIFEEFYQVDHGTQRPEGLGLGLSIVRRLAGLLGCTITVDSAPGKGTVFHVTVPAADMPAAPHESAETRAVATSGLVLVVDDEKAVAEATGMLLEVEGFTVRIASCEREALEHASRATPDLIVSDYHLRGGETGIGVVRAVRNRLGEAIPVVFVTGDTARSALDKVQIENARVLSKPMRADELLAIVQEQVTARRLQLG